MKMKILMLLAVVFAAGLLLPSCTVVQRKPDGSVSGYMFGTDADAMALDGPAPVAVATAPTYNKKGVVTGSKTIYGPGDPNGPKVLFAAYGLNHSKGLGKVVNGFIAAVGLVVQGQVQEAADAASAANEAKKIAADKSVAQQKLSNEAAKDSYKHTENMVELESAVPAATSTVTP